MFLCCFQGPRGTALLMSAISTRHCTVFKVPSVLHDIDSLSFCCVVFDSATKVNARTDLEQKARTTAHSPQQQRPPRLTAAATAATKPPPRLRLTMKQIISKKTIYHDDCSSRLRYLNAAATLAPNLSKWPCRRIIRSNAATGWVRHPTIKATKRTPICSRARAASSERAVMS